MAKPHLVAREFTRAELEQFLAVLAPGRTFSGYEYLFGGLSTTTVKIFFDTDDVNSGQILKIFYPNSVSVVNSMEICSYIHKAEPAIRITYPLCDLQFVELTNDTFPRIQFPVVLMSLVPNSVSGDKYGDFSGGKLGSLLASLHTVHVPKDSSLQTYVDGGAVDLHMHVSGQFIDRISAVSHSEPRKKFAQFYQEEFSTVNLDNFATGIIHGDPFMDNILVDKQSGQATLVDFEDSCIGPLVFDIGSALGGCVWKSNGNTINWDYATLFLAGYMSVRCLPENEICSLVKFMRIGLLCSCAFRFVSLANTPHSNAYLELFTKAEYLKKNEIEFTLKFKEIIDRLAN